MQKRWKVLIALACLALLVAAIFVLNREKEPHYNGRLLSQWIRASHAESTTERTKAKEAVCVIGTNAIPTLLKWLRYEPPGWQAPLLRIIPRSLEDKPAFHSWINRRRGRADDAVTAFGILFTNAAPAVPELSVLMRDKRRPETADRAINALSFIGTPALHALASALRDRNQPFRREVAEYMGFYLAPDVGTNPCLRALEAAMKDPDTTVSTAAAYTIRFLTPTNAAHE